MILENHRVLVTGGSRGIGRGIALEMAREGADVVINYVRSSGAADEVASEIRAMGRRAEAVQADISNPEDAKNLVASAVEFLGGLTVVVNNAGITRDTLLMAMKDEDWRAVLSTNLDGTMYVCRAAVRHLLRPRRDEWAQAIFGQGGRGGSIINLTSVSGMVGMMGQTNYSASKAGIIGFTKALAKEIGKRGVTVNAVAPGFIATEMTEAMHQGVLEEAMKLIPLQRQGEVEEVARSVAFLASNHARYITGQVLVVDGGLTM